MKQAQNKKIRKNFGQRFRGVRIGLGLKQAELAKKLGFHSHVPISRLERGMSSPTLQILVRLTQVAEIDLHWLATGRRSPVITELLNVLKPAIEQYLSQLSTAIKDREGRCLGLEIRQLFDEDCAKELKKVRQEIQGLNRQYEGIVAIIAKGRGK